MQRHRALCCVGQVSELQGQVSRLEAEKEELERELDTQTNHTHKQVGPPLRASAHSCEPVQSYTHAVVPVF